MTVPVPPPPADGLTDDQIVAIVRHYRSLASEVAELQAEMKSIQERVDEARPIGWKMDIDGVPASKRGANREFCAITALGLLAPEQKEAAILRDPRIDPKLLRKVAEDAGILEQCMVERATDQARPVVKLS